MLARVVAEIRDPDDHPDQADQAQDDEAPRQAGSAISSATIGGVTALPSRAKEWVSPARSRACRRRPVLHGAGGGGEGRALAEAQQHAGGEQADKPPDQAGQDGRGRPDQAADEQGLRGPKRSPTQPPITWNTGTDSRRPRRPARDGSSSSRIPPDRARRRGDVDPVDIGDEIHHAQQRQQTCVA